MKQHGDFYTFKNIVVRLSDVVAYSREILYSEGSGFPYIDLYLRGQSGSVRARLCRTEPSKHFEEFCDVVGSLEPSIYQFKA